MKPLWKAALLIILALSSAALAQNEQASMVEKEFDYENWKFPNLSGSGKTELRDFMAGKRLVLVVYYAAWCPNWKHEAPFVQKLHEKYTKDGLGVIGVGEYDSVENMRSNLTSLRITFPVVYESTELQDKRKTTHFRYRSATGDMRNWGSPWHIFIDPATAYPKGDTVTRTAQVVNGELIEEEIERFVRGKLGLEQS
jgi:thiol-disulfide isomerase/thioredoxin